MINHLLEKNSQGHLQGLILKWECVQCEKLYMEPLVRSEATFGEKNCICPECKGEFCVKFSPSTMMSEREKIVQQALPFIPLDKHKEILEDLAWIESLLVMEDSESVGRSYWDDLKKEINYLVQHDQYTSKKEGKNSKSNKK